MKDILILLYSQEILPLDSVLDSPRNHLSLPTPLEFVYFADNEVRIVHIVCNGQPVAPWEHFYQVR